MAKRALIFSLAYYPHLVGGAEVAVKEITDRISPNEIEFDMVTLYAGSSRYERIGNVNIYRVGPHIRVHGTTMPHISYLIKFRYVASAFFKSIFLHHKYHYDFIWSVMASFNGFSALFFKLIHRKVPFLLTLQEGDTPEHIKKATGIMYPLYKKIFTNANHIQSISKFLNKYGRSMGATCPSTVVPNGVDVELFSHTYTSSQMKALEHELGLDPFDSVLITTSRLVAKNGIADIIDALAYLPTYTKLLILGTGPLDKFLRDKTILLKLEKRVTFVGFVPNRELPLYMRVSDIFIRPSLSEGMGISFIEAMASGLPVIATEVGGIPDFLTDGVTGLFCEVNNPRSIAEKVELLIGDETLRNTIVKNAREMVRTKYDWKFIVGDMKKVFNLLD